MKKVILINDRDNVVTATVNLAKGYQFKLEIGASTFAVELRDAIKLGHKVAIKSIAQGEPIIKYGEVMGLATEPISPGEHVHTHNVCSQRGRGDLV